MLIMFFTTYFIDNLALRGFEYITITEDQIEYETLSVRLLFHLNDRKLRSNHSCKIEIERTMFRFGISTATAFNLE